MYSRCGLNLPHGEDLLLPSCIGDAHQVSAGNRQRRDDFWVTIQEKFVEEKATITERGNLGFSGYKLRSYSFNSALDAMRTNVIRCRTLTHSRDFRYLSLGHQEVRTELRVLAWSSC